MPKPNRNGCKNGKKTNSLVQGTRRAVQKSQVTLDRKFSANSKVCIILLSDKSHPCLAKYVNLKQNNHNIEAKIFYIFFNFCFKYFFKFCHIWQNLKKEETRQAFKV